MAGTRAVIERVSLSNILTMVAMGSAAAMAWQNFGRSDAAMQVRVEALEMKLGRAEDDIAHLRDKVSEITGQLKARGEK